VEDIEEAAVAGVEADLAEAEVEVVGLAGSAAVVQAAAGLAAVGSERGRK
jgi:hypothetical protein